uniref:Peroxisome assembly protein 12 n=1 Tax=Peronospora matthiolae TaxID=2874970 RepID=A0AAV1VA97_9STRA
MPFLEQTQGFAAPDSHVSAPSLFELLMQEQMEKGVKPAVEYVLHTLCESLPNLACALPVRRLDESYALLQFWIQRYFLARYDCLATEKFYGMKRVMLKTVDGKSAGEATSGLTPRAKKLALLFAVVVPYLKLKLDAYHKETAELLSRTAVQSTSARTNTVTSTGQRYGVFLRRLRSIACLQALKKSFVTAYPFAHFAYEGSFFVYKWLYLFGDTPFFSPFFRCMKTILVRVSAEDANTFRQNDIAYRKKVMERLSGSGLFNRICQLAIRTVWATSDHSYVLLLLGIAGYKFVEWMYSEEGVSAKLRYTGSKAPVPSPPLPPQFSGQALALAAMDPAFCPLCKQKRVNPAMTDSGYVFCYPCIYRYVEHHGKCPITQMKCELTAITKIYDDARDP